MVKGNSDNHNVAELFAEGQTDKLNIGFPPYWNPEEGSKIFCEPVVVDARDPEFIRYICIALAPLIGMTGSKRNELQEEVQVEVGEKFSLSAYASLPLEQLMGDPRIPICIEVVGKEPVQSNPKNDRWVFNIIVPKRYSAMAKLRAKEYVPALPAKKPSVNGSSRRTTASARDDREEEIDAGGRL